MKEPNGSNVDQQTSREVRKAESNVPGLSTTTTSSRHTNNKRSYNETDINDDQRQNCSKYKKTCPDASDHDGLKPADAMDPNTAKPDTLEPKPSKSTMPSNGRAHLTIAPQILSQLYEEGKAFSITIREQGSLEPPPSEPVVKDVLGTVKTVELYENGLVFRISSFAETKPSVKETTKEESTTPEVPEAKIDDDPGNRPKLPPQTPGLSESSPNEDANKNSSKELSPNEEPCTAPQNPTQDDATSPKVQPPANEPPESESESDSEDEFEIITHKGGYCGGNKPAKKKPTKPYHPTRPKFFKNRSWVNPRDNNKNNVASTGSSSSPNTKFYKTDSIAGKRDRSTDDEGTCSIESLHSSKRLRSSYASPPPPPPVTRPLSPAPAPAPTIDAAQALKEAKLRAQTQHKQRRAEYRTSTNNITTAAPQRHQAGAGALRPSIPSSLNRQPYTSTAPSSLSKPPASIEKYSPYTSTAPFSLSKPPAPIQEYSPHDRPFLSPLPDPGAPTTPTPAQILAPTLQDFERWCECLGLTPKESLKAMGYIHVIMRSESGVVGRGTAKAIVALCMVLSKGNGSMSHDPRLFARCGVGMEEVECVRGGVWDCLWPAGEMKR